MDGSDFVDRENWDVLAEATMTFFEWGKTRYAINQKKSHLRQARQALKKIEDAVRLEVKTTYLNLQTAERNISVAQKSVESAKENFRISKERYRQQVATATEVLDAQTRLTQAKTNHTNALVEFNVAQARLIEPWGLKMSPERRGVCSKKILHFFLDFSPHVCFKKNVVIFSPYLGAL